MPALRRRRSYAWLIASLLITATAMVPLAYVTFPHIYRWRMLWQIDSSDLDRRERSLRYVLTQAPKDPRVLRGAIGRLGTLDDTAFFQLVQTLDLAGQWRRPTIPDEMWFRWIAPLVSDPKPDARIVACHRLADLSNIPTDPRIIAHLHQLQSDADANVRLNALAAVAELAGAARFRKIAARPLDDLILDAARDSEPRVARDAFIFIGLLDPASGISANWRETPIDVAEAIVWAAVRTNPAFAQVVSDAPDDRLRSIVAYALGQAAVAEHSDLPPPLQQLARYESAAVGELSIAIPPDMPDMLRLAAVAVTKDPRPDDLRPLFRSDEPSMRDLACVVAQDRFTPEQLSQLAGDLLREFDDRAKMSGAILCGLTGLRPRAASIDPATGQHLKDIDLLAYRLEHEDVWVVQQVLRLAMAMQGETIHDAEGRDLDARKLSVALLSMSDAVPLTTVLLAMLHTHDPAALEYLLNPRGDERVDLIQLLDQQRWWRVLRRYLPENHPPFWWWADPDLERFQVDVLRNWYLVHRTRIRAEWGESTLSPGSSRDGEAGQQ